MNKIIFAGAALLCTSMLFAEQVFRQPTAEELKKAAIPELKNPVSMSIQGKNTVRVEARLADGTVLRESFNIEPVASQTVRNEIHTNVPVFNARKWGWNKGSALQKTRGFIDSLKQGSLVLKDGPDSNAQKYMEGKDYRVDERWGTFGTLPGSRISSGTKVYADYEKAMRRIDSILLHGKSLKYRKGKEAPFAPEQPEPGKGEIRIANIVWIGGEKQLTEQNLFPIAERRFPVESRPVAGELLPWTMKKLRSGTPLKILAWGDSVTEGYHELKKDNRWHHRWQEQFARRLRDRFPNAKIELATEGWGGHNTTHYLETKAGEIHSYQDKVLNVKPDLLIFEFLNDSGMRDPAFTERYERILKDLRKAKPDMEIIAILPHHTSGGSNTDGKDDRPYIQLMRNFCAKHRLVYADVSHRYSRLHRQGIPPMLLMVNNHNHPLEAGMRIYADALMELFPAE